MGDPLKGCIVARRLAKELGSHPGRHPYGVDIPVYIVQSVADLLMNRLQVLGRVDLLRVADLRPILKDIEPFLLRYLSSIIHLRGENAVGFRAIEPVEEGLDRTD